MFESICAIGFSGHRELSSSELIHQKIADVLDDIAGKTTSRLVGVCSVAIGADMIFIEACLKRNLPWIAILPMPTAMFFNEKDFGDETARTQAIGLVETAAHVEITNPTTDQSLKYDREYRKNAFGDSGQRIVDYCDIFVAALRPTHDPLKPGGTGDILEYAKRCRRPLAIIDPGTGHLEHHHWQPPFLSPLVTEIRSLPETPLRREFLSADSSRELRVVVDWFSRLSAAARRNVPRLRSLSSTAVLLHGSAVILALALITLPWLFLNNWHHLAEWFKVILAGAAFVATGWFILGKPHERAARYRLGAEICRSLMATWKLPATHQEIFRGVPAEYRAFVRALLNCRHLEGPKLEELRSSQDSAPDPWRKSISEYVNDRVNKQLHYYKREQEKARHRLHIFEPLIWICAFGGLCVAAGLAVVSLRGYSATGEQAEHMKQFVKFSNVAFPFLAGTLIGLLAVHEATRRKGRYGEMLEVLKENAARLKFAPHKQAACDAVIDNERALLAENVEWANTAKYPATV